MIELLAFVAVGGAIAGIRGLVKAANRPARGGKSLRRSRGRGAGRRSQAPRGAGRDRAEAALGERYARGEIDADEYQERLAKLWPARGDQSWLITAYNATGAPQVNAATAPEAMAELGGKAVGGTLRAGGRLTGRAGGAAARVSGRRWERRTQDREATGDAPWPILRRVDTSTERPDGHGKAGTAPDGEVQVFVPMSGTGIAQIDHWRPWIAESLEDARREDRPPGQPVFLDEATARAYAQSHPDTVVDVVPVTTRPLRFPGKTTAYLSQETTADLGALQRDRRRQALKGGAGTPAPVAEDTRPAEPATTPAAASAPLRLAVAPQTPDRPSAGQATDEGGNKMMPSASPAAGDSAAAAAPGDFAQVIGRITNYEPESDTDLLRFMAGETAGVCGYADAMGQLYETCVNSVGLDPSAVQGLADYASTMTEAAESMTKAHRQFLTVYQEVMAAAERGVVMPHSGRFITGQSA